MYGSASLLSCHVFKLAIEEREQGTGNRERSPRREQGIVKTLMQIILIQENLG